MNGKKLVVLVGPTAVGKTGLAIRVATSLRTEIVSADSRQIYADLSIGTARPSADELNQVNHHMIGFRSLEDDYDAGQFGRDALVIINRLFATHDAVILAGGSGLYIRAVCDGFDEMPDVAPAIRQQIMANYEDNGLEWLQDRVRQVDPAYFSMVDQKNPHRLVRALELFEATGKTMGEFRIKKKHDHPFEVIKIGLELERDELFARIDRRMDSMVDAGLFEEARQFHSMKNLNALQTVGYQEIFGFFDGYYDKEEAIRLLKRNSRRYAKRQITWFKKDPDIKWFHPDNFDGVMKLVNG